MECSNKCCCCLRQYINAVVSGIGLKSFQAQLSLSPSLLLADGSTVPFNEVLSPNPSIITPNPDGSFTVKKAGTYNVNYFVNTDGTDGATSLVFSVNGIPSQSNLVQGQLNGFATLSLLVGDIITLATSTTGIVQLGSDPIQAGILITTV